MNFLSETVPDHAAATIVAPCVRRLVASNAGPMTYHGTNTYLIDWDDGVGVIDPGPDDAAHVGHLLQSAGAPIRAILLTHGHHDHWGALAALKAASGAAVYGWHNPFTPEVRPDVALQDGAVVGGLRALHTPGHAPDHLCFASPTGVIFSGDVVMGWSTTVVGGAGGDMAAYFASLERLLGTASHVYLPGSRARHSCALRLCRRAIGPSATAGGGDRGCTRCYSCDATRPDGRDLPGARFHACPGGRAQRSGPSR